MQRRRLLKLGLASAVFLGAGGAAIALWQPGLTAGRLTPGGRGILRAAAQAILDGSLPTQDGARTLALDAFMDRMETLVGGLPPHAQSELNQLLAVLGTSPGRRLIAGLETEWPSATPAQLHAALESMRHASWAVRRQAYQALHDLSGGAYFSSPATWHALGYPGPLVL